MLQDSEIKTFKSVEAGYTHTAEIYVTTTEASKLYDLAEILTQKLDETVTISPVKYSISDSALAHCRSAWQLNLAYYIPSYVDDSVVPWSSYSMIKQE